MPGRLIVVTGTDTGIGKTHLATALLLAAAARGHAALGYKPVESGVDGASLTDAARLLAASSPAARSFHVKQPRIALRAPISPHLAAEREGASVPWDAILAWTTEARRHLSLLVELPGGLFTPLSDRLLNADAARQLAPELTILVAPDRLGVLHHVLAACAAARAADVTLGAVVLVAPELADASTGSNAAELRRFTDVPVVGPCPRATAEELAADPAILEISRRWLPA